MKKQPVLPRFAERDVDHSFDRQGRLVCRLRFALTKKEKRAFDAVAEKHGVDASEMARALAFTKEISGVDFKPSSERYESEVAFSVPENMYRLLLGSAAAAGLRPIPFVRRRIMEAVYSETKRAKRKKA